MVAFEQHYSLNWVSWNADDRNPWTNAEAIVNEDFGNASSILSALIANPKAFGAHVFENLKNIPRSIISTFVSSYPFTRWGRPGVALGILFVFSSMVIFALQSKLITHNRVSWLKERIQATWFEIFSVLIILAPNVISILVIYPRSHYILILGVLASFIATIFLTKGTDGYSHQNVSTILLVSGLALLLIRPISLPPGAGAQPNIRTIEFLRALDIKRPVKLLEAEGG